MVVVPKGDDKASTEIMTEWSRVLNSVSDVEAGCDVCKRRLFCLCFRRGVLGRLC